MALIDKRVTQVEIQSCGDVFHELFKSNPHQVPSLSPTTIQNVQTHDGEVGTVGSVLLWNYFHDGKDQFVKTLIKDINESKRLVTFEVLEGDLLELYKTFVLHVHVDTHGANNLVTWTVEYEKLNPDVPDPDTLKDFYTKMTKDIESHHLTKVEPSLTKKVQDVKGETSLFGKRVTQVEIKSCGDVFHELFKLNPHQVPSLSPTTIQNVQTHDGEVGTVGSVLIWNYFHDGKDQFVKTLIKDINEDKKLVTFEVQEGDLLELYKTFVLHVHVDTHGANNLVTWTVEYEKLTPDVPDPDTLKDFYTKMTKDIETHHLKA